VRSLRLRFFSRRVFGAWVDAEVIVWGVACATLRAQFHGNVWNERVKYGTEVYDLGGNAFILERRCTTGGETK
jgi:hypothetical protein